MSSAKRELLRFYFFLSEQIGLDFLKFFRSCRGLPRYLIDLCKFKLAYTGKLVLNPCLGDRYNELGETKSEYFWQDLLVAKMIYESQPQKHVDIGSRIDGFVAHVASFRDIEIFDIRPLSVSIPGVYYRQVDIMSPDVVSYAQTFSDGYSDSISCLHAIEHFGLGRYGDPIDPVGYLRGITNICGLLKKGGTLYLSTPLGQQRVEFNANWVFDPLTIMNHALSNGLVLNLLIIVDQLGVRNSVRQPDHQYLQSLAAEFYCLGIFCFIKS